MKSKFLLAFLVSFVALSGIAHAQATTPNYWVVNSASSTIAPRTSGLQLPCANIVGGCVSGGSSTSTINGVVGPTFTFSIVSTSSASSVTTSSQNLFLNLLSYTSSSDITISPTGTIIFANHNISQFTNNVPYLTSSTGVTSFNGSFGAITYAPSTTIPTNNSQLTNGSGYLTSSTGVSSITGTAGQVNVSAGTGAVTLSLPQNVNTTSSPTYSNLTLSSGGVLTLTTPTTTAFSSLVINNSSSSYPAQMTLSNIGSITNTDASSGAHLIAVDGNLELTRNAQLFTSSTKTWYYDTTSTSANLIEIGHNGIGLYTANSSSGSNGTITLEPLFTGGDTGSGPETQFNAEVAINSTASSFLVAAPTTFENNQPVQFQPGVNISVGTTTHISVLTILADNNSAGLTTIVNTSTNIGALSFDNGTHIAGQISEHGGATDDMYFNTSSTSNALVIKNNGNIAIGNTTGVNKLDVSGSGDFTGNLGVGGTTTSTATITDTGSLNVSQTSTFQGNVIASAYSTATSSANSQITQLNKTVWIPNQASLTAFGCPGFTSDTTVDTCVNDWYQNNSSTASSTDFYLSAGTYTWTDPTGFSFNNTGEQASLHCTAGDGTRLVDNAATGTIGTIGWGTVPTAGAGVFGCAFFGANTVASISSSTGNIGWLVNAPYVTFRDNHFTQFSDQIYLNTNTYLNTIDNNYFGYAGSHEIYAPNSGNSGESNTLTNNTFATLGNSTTSACVYLNTQSTNISGKSNDGCTIEVGGLAHVSMTGVHHETINTGIYGAYYPVQVDAGGVLTEVDGDYQQDGTGSNVASGFILNAGVVHEVNAALWANPSSTPNLIVNTGAGVSTEVGTDLKNSPGTAVTSFALTGTGNYLPQWNASGTSLTSTSSVSMFQSGNNKQIGINGTSSTSVDELYVTNSSSSGDAQIELNNSNSGNGAYYRLNANSNYVSNEFVGTGSDWKIGEFGSTGFSLLDGTNGRKIIAITLGAPTSSITINGTGLVSLASAASSTIRIGTGAGNPGCFESYDWVNSSTIEYSGSSNGAWVTTTTKPIFCQ